jgi:hypothetical protein
MVTLTRQDAIERIQEFEENAGYGTEDMPKATSRAKLNKMSDSQLIEALEDLTTNYGTYSIE